MEANTSVHPSPLAAQDAATPFSMTFSLCVYGYFFWVFTALIFFVGSISGNFGTQLPQVVTDLFPYNLDGPRGFSSMENSPVSATTLVLNFLPLFCFALQHMVMARGPFKKFVTANFYPTSIERSVFVLAASIILHFMFLLWTPIPAVLWELPKSLQAAVWASHALGWVLVFASTFMIDHFDLFGVKPGFGIPTNLGGSTFCTPFLYKYIRHPIMAGFMLAFWSAPVMTVGRFLFSAILTSWILLDVKFLEEADLKRHFPVYAGYCAQVESTERCRRLLNGLSLQLPLESLPRDMLIPHELCGCCACSQVGAYLPTVHSCGFKAFTAQAVGKPTTTVSANKEE